MVSDYWFHCLFLDNKIWFGREREDGSVGAELGDGSDFFRIYFLNMFLCYDSKPLHFSHWHESVGQGNDYFF